jgi:hypothetical protein
MREALTFTVFISVLTFIFTFPLFVIVGVTVASSKIKCNSSVLNYHPGYVVGCLLGNRDDH